MNKFSFVILMQILLTSIYSQALVAGAVSGESPNNTRKVVHTLCDWAANTGDEKLTGYCMITTAPTTMPTLLVDGQEVDLGSQESSARLDLEAQGLADKQIISIIAQDKNTTVEAVTTRILQMKQAGIEVSVESVLTSLAEQ